MHEATKEKEASSLKAYLETGTVASDLEPRITKLIDKALVPLGVVQHILLDFLKASDVELHQRIISESNIHISFSGLLSSRLGVAVACYIFTVAEAKYRKYFIKELKEDVVALASNKATFLIILKMLRSTDDTVLTKRVLLSKLIGEAGEAMKTKEYQKVLGSLVSQD